MNQTLVQDQFGKNAAHYLTSKTHAQGKSLERLVTLTAPQASWRMLDVATGGGHVAYTFASHVARVWATDVTQEMLDQVKAEAARRGLANVRVAFAKAEALPFEDESFDLVTCRIAPHHFEFDPRVPRRGAPRAQARRAGGHRRQHRAGRPGRRLHQRLRAAARPEPSARLDDGGMARRIRCRRARRRPRGRVRQDNGVQDLDRALRRRHDGTAAVDADAGRARGESGARAERRRRRHDVPPARRAVHRQRRDPDSRAPDDREMSPQKNAGVPWTPAFCIERYARLTSWRASSISSSARRPARPAPRGCGGRRLGRPASCRSPG